MRAKAVAFKRYIIILGDFDGVLFLYFENPLDTRLENLFHLLERSWIRAETVLLLFGNSLFFFNPSLIIVSWSRVLRISIRCVTRGDRRLPLEDVVKEGVVVERTAPVLVHVPQLWDVWSLLVLESIINILLSHYKVSAKLVKILEAVASEELFDDRVPNCVTQFEMTHRW